MRNSNILNFGYLTYDEAGNIYYCNKEDGQLYTSDSKGKNKRLITENSEVYGWLQLKDEWLYYSDTMTRINRVDINTGNRQILSDEYSGVFFVDGENIYFEDKENGFSSQKIDGNDKKVEFATKGYLDVFTKGDIFWLANMYGASKKNMGKKLSCKI